MDQFGFVLYIRRLKLIHSMSLTYSNKPFPYHNPISTDGSWLTVVDLQWLASNSIQIQTNAPVLQQKLGLDHWLWNMSSQIYIYIALFTI